MANGGRENLPTETRLTLLETEIVGFKTEVSDLKDKISEQGETLIKILVSLVTASILLAINLVIQYASNTP